jgi:uncharacterized protein (AIM24 family)
MDQFNTYQFEGDLPNGFQICGEVGQLLHIDLQPSQVIIAEPGAMVYTSNDVRSKLKSKGVLSSIKSSLGGEGLFKIHWDNNGSNIGYIGLSPDYPATIIPIDMRSYPDGILCKKDAFMAAVSTNTETSAQIIDTNSCLACCCSGLDLVMQKVVGGDNMAFLAAHGTILTKELAERETIVVDTNCIVAFSPTVTIDVTIAGSCTSVCCMGEGIFNTTLTGPGIVYLSSMPLEKIRDLLGAIARAQMNQSSVINSVSSG